MQVLTVGKEVVLRASTGEELRLDWREAELLCRPNDPAVLYHRDSRPYHLGEAVAEARRVDRGSVQQEVNDLENKLANLKALLRVI